MADNAEWLEWLAVEHVARGGATHLDIAYSFFDYMEPPLSHRFDVTAPDAEVLVGLRGDEENLPAPKPGEPIARLVVNELPIHLKKAARDSWFWLCDRCESGPTACLGGVLDALESAGTLDFGDETSGTVLHLQNLEVAPWFRRKGIGSRLIRFSLTLLSRSDQDVAVAELTPVRGVHPPLIEDPTSNFTRLIWEDEEPLRKFMSAIGFAEAKGVNSLPSDQLQQLGMVDESVVFYRQLTAEDRLGQLVHGRDV